MDISKNIELFIFLILWKNITLSLKEEVLLNIFNIENIYFQLKLLVVNIIKI